MSIECNQMRAQQSLEREESPLKSKSNNFSIDLIAFEYEHKISQSSQSSKNGPNMHTPSQNSKRSEEIKSKIEQEKSISNKNSIVVSSKAEVGVIINDCIIL